MDTAIVKVYKQAGVSPNPATDPVLGTDTSFPAGVWGINTTGWTEGRYRVYAQGLDLAGNESGFESRIVGILPYPTRVSGLIAWTLGELAATQIGSLGG